MMTYATTDVVRSVVARRVTTRGQQLFIVVVVVWFACAFLGTTAKRVVVLPARDDRQDPTGGI